MSIVKLNNKAVSNATAFGSISSLGSMTFIKKLTASGSGTLSFVDGASGVVLDNSYKEYLFTFKNIHPATNNAKFQFNLSTDGGSNYNVTKTTSFYQAYHAENNNAAALGYSTGNDLQQSTSFQNISSEISSADDAHTSGTMTLYNPSSTTFAKHFMSRVQVDNNYYAQDEYMAGYGNTTSAVDAIQFKYSSGNIDAGDICLYGIA